MRHRWPGNVRELSNLLERLSVLHGERIVQAQDLPARYRGGENRMIWPHAENSIELSPEGVANQSRDEKSLAAPPRTTVMESAFGPSGLDLKDHLSGIEEVIIRKALGVSNGAVAGAARLLGMRRTTLVEKLRKYRLTCSHSIQPRS
jgi:sigma-54 specific flagellar transcriptional regulator A